MLKAKNKKYQKRIWDRHDILLQVEQLITKASDSIWPVFLPFILVVGAIIAVFGANVVFEAVDLLLFVLSGINVTALAIFTFKHWEVYKLKAENSNNKAA